MKVDLIGKRFNKLLVVKKLNKDKFRNMHWLCLCDCGGTATPTTAALNKKNTQSCGCLSYEKFIDTITKHSMRYLPEYNVWRNMKARCYSKKSHRYENYGGRGITICSQWLNDFKQFITDMGERPSTEHQIDRKNNNGNYTPDNCHWVTNEVNARNKSTSRIWIVDGVKYATSTEAAEAHNVNTGTIHAWCNGRRLNCSSRLIYE